MSGRLEWPWRPVKGYFLGGQERERDLREDDGLMAVAALRSMSDERALVLNEAEAQIARTLADAVLRRLATATYSSVTEDADADERRVATSLQVLQHVVDHVGGQA